MVNFGIIYLSFSFLSIIFIIFIIAGNQIINRFKIAVGKSKDYGIVYEMKTNRAVKEHIVQFSGDTMEIGDKTYNITQEDIFISDNYKCKSVVVSEALRSSVNPSGDNTGMDMATVTKLIKRAKSAGAQDALEFIQQMKKMIPIGAVIMVGGLGIIIFLCWQILNKLGGGAVL